MILLWNWRLDWSPLSMIDAHKEMVIIGIQVHMWIVEYDKKLESAPSSELIARKFKMRCKALFREWNDVALVVSLTIFYISWEYHVWTYFPAFEFLSQTKNHLNPISIQFLFYSNILHSFSYFGFCGFCRKMLNRRPTIRHWAHTKRSQQWYKIIF